jgi:ubiquinone/menaquinone biosynthesis C-methylase UbiE
MGLYTDRVLPRLTDMALSSREFARIRARVASQLAGDVLEVGFGSGRNVPYYPREVARVLAVEPAAGGRRLATKRITASTTPVDFIGTDGQRLPVEDDSIDHVLTTWTLCTIPDVQRALAEIHRVLRPGGALHVGEHGRSPDAKVARWQDRFTPIQRRIAGGCHLNRPIDELIAGGGLELAQLDTYAMRGPKMFGFMFEGVAIKR